MKEKINLQVDTSTKYNIEKGQEKLLNSCVFKTVPGELEVIVAVDPGSTEFRVIVIDNITNPDVTAYKIPSVCGFINEDTVIKNQGNLIYEQLCSNIKNTSANASKVKNRTIVRGAVLENMMVSEENITNSEGKVNSELLYANIVDGIVYAVAQKYDGKIPETLRVTLATALPPNNLNGLDSFVSNINSTFLWEHKLTGVKTKVEILTSSKVILSEADAFAKGYIFAEKQGKFPEVMVSMSAGGSTLVIELMVRGRAIDACSVTLNTSGSTVLEKLGKLIAKNYNIRDPRKKSLEVAIRTGVLPFSSTTIDVTNEIAIVLEEIARDIYTSFTKKVLDSQDRYGINDINLFLMSGKSFRSGEYGISILDYLSDLIKQQSPYVDILYKDTDYTALGEAFMAISSYGGNLPKTPLWQS